MSEGRGRSANAVGAKSIILALVAALCLSWCAIASAASSSDGHSNQAKDSQFTSSGIERYSAHPSGEHPYFACPPPSKKRASCNAVVVPDGAMKAVRRQRKALGLTGGRIGTPALEGSGVDGGFSPADLRSAYKLSEAGGKGSTIAVVIAWNNPFAETDLEAYRSHYGLPPCNMFNGCFQKVNQKGEKANYPSNGSAAGAEGWELESTLDIEMASAICPECHITLVEANSEYFKDLGPAENTAASLGATVISNSFGGHEFEEETEFDSLYYAHPGVPMLVSSGDSGYGTAYPSASPNVISVGGTSLGKDEGARGWRERAWVGAGSGCSPFEKKPAWQTDEGCPNRTIADVSAVADPDTPVSVYAYGWTQQGQTEPGWVRLGGTSVAAPIVAGVEARLSSEERAEGAELFWKKGPEGKLFDVADGRNGRCGLKKDYLCAGRVGYDGPSGWGTPGGSRPAPPVVGAHDATDITPHGATLTGEINPNGESTTYRFEWGETTEYGNFSPAKEASAGSGTEAVEVSTVLKGLSADTTYHYRLVATSSKGTTRGYDHSFVASSWATQFLYIFASFSNLADVSCPESTGCMAAGSYFLPFEPGGIIGNYAPLGERWDGSEWMVKEALPAHESGEGYHSEFNGVSCISANECLAVGARQEDKEGILSLSERWNGAEWKIVSTPIPADAAKNEFGLYSVELRDVSCPAVSLCVAVGDYATESQSTTVTERKTLVEDWNGTEWQIGTSPNPVGQKLSYLDDVSCSSITSCVAVGHQGTHNDEFPQDEAAKTLVESWNGSAWSVQPSPSAAEAGSYLESVSCVSASSCMAVGHVYQAQAKEYYDREAEIMKTHREGLAERWDGSEWKMASPAMPLSSVSCAESDLCVGAGHVGGENPEYLYAVRGAVEVWNGSEWSLDEPPLPSDHYSIPQEEEYEQELLGISSESEQTGVSCQGSTCTVVGWYLSPWGQQWISDKLDLAGVLPEPSPAFSSSFGSSGAGNGQFSSPNGIAIDSSGNLWVADSTNGRVEKFNPKGEYLSQFGSVGSGNGQFKPSRGIAVDSSGNLWVVDSGNSRVEEFNSKGEYLAKFGSPGSGDGKFSAPYGIAIDSSGNLWVIDASGNRVQKFNPKGEYLAKFGSSGTGNGQFKNPRAIAIDSAGNLWVADSGNNRVQKFNPKGEYLSQFGSEGTGDGQLTLPSGIAIDSAGNLWITDSNNNRVQKFNPKGEYLAKFGTSGTGNGQFKSPIGLAIDASGSFWVVDSGNNRVEKWVEPPPTFSSSFGTSGTGNGQFSTPHYTAVDLSGNLWVTDSNNNRVQKFNPKGEYLSQFGTSGTGNGQFKAPEDIAIDSAGNLWVTDSNNNRVQKFNPKGEYLSQFGSVGSGNGQFKPSRGIAIDSSGNLWVIDSGNARVEEFNPKGEYLTKFGSLGSADGKFFSPDDIAIDSAGNLWVTDSNNRVQKFNSRGEYLTKFGSEGSGNGQFKTPYGIAIDSSGSFWIVDNGNNRVERWR